MSPDPLEPEPLESLDESSPDIEPESSGVAVLPVPPPVGHSRSSSLCSASSHLPRRSRFDPSVSLGEGVGDGLGRPIFLEGARTDRGVAASDRADTKYAAADNRIGRIRAARTPKATRRLLMIPR